MDARPERGALLRRAGSGRTGINIGEEFAQGSKVPSCLIRDSGAQRDIRLPKERCKLAHQFQTAPFKPVADDLKARLLAQIKSVENEQPEITDAPQRDPLQLTPHKGAGVDPSRMNIDPCNSPLLDVAEEFSGKR